MFCIPDKTAKKNAQALLPSFRLHALTSLNRIWELHWSRAVHVDAHFRLSSLKRRRPMNHTDFPDFLEIAFNVLLPGRKSKSNNHPTILKFEDNDDTVGPARKWLRIVFAVLAMNQRMKIVSRKTIVFACEDSLEGRPKFRRCADRPRATPHDCRLGARARRGGESAARRVKSG